MSWLITPLLLTVLRAQWKAERENKLSAAREAALTDEKKMIESRIRVEDLPSWVFFPDKVSNLKSLKIARFKKKSSKSSVIKNGGRFHKNQRT